MDDPVTFVSSMIGISDCSSSLQKACHRIFHQSQKSERKHPAKNMPMDWKIPIIFTYNLLV